MVVLLLLIAGVARCPALHLSLSPGRGTVDTLLLRPDTASRLCFAFPDMGGRDRRRGRHTELRYVAVYMSYADAPLDRWQHIGIDVKSFRPTSRAGTWLKVIERSGIPITRLVHVLKVTAGFPVEVIDSATGPTGSPPRRNLMTIAARLEDYAAMAYSVDLVDQSPTRLSAHVDGHSVGGTVTVFICARPDPAGHNFRLTWLDLQPRRE